MQSIKDRVDALRKVMSREGVNAFIIPSSDPHQSEYVAEHWLCRQWISNFSGSAGTAMVADNHAGVWTDSRYFLQGEQELADTPFELHRMVNQFSESYSKWLQSNLSQGDTVGINGYNFSISQVEKLESLLKKKNINLKTDANLIDLVWKEGRPELPLAPIFQHKAPFAAITAEQKIQNILQKTQANYVLLSALDDIVWTLNLRGRDVDFNPVFIAYLLLHEGQSTLYINESKVSPEIKELLHEQGIVTKSYDTVSEDLSNLSSTMSLSLDPDICSYALSKAVACEIVRETSPARLLKAIKTDNEIEHIRQAMIKDGVALTKAFKWLEDNVNSTAISEYDFAMKLAECRAEQDNYFGESFPAIIGYKGNGAIIHYRPKEDSSATIQSSGVLLADSGGQYHDGTTDITRTIAMGNDIDEETKLAYTCVLKGMIALDKSKIPHGTQGGQIDAYARQFLWQHGLNYLHGTGHGVGYFLNVHEPPQGFTAGPSSRSNTVLKAGMITSNEPGHYKAGKYGIRIENCIVTKQSEHEGFLEHESLTVFPIDTAMLLMPMLTVEELQWLNGYHQRVYDLLSPRVSVEEQEWLKNKCKPI